MSKKPVLKAAKKGYDIRTADPKNLAVDTTKNQLKLYARISITTDDPIT